MSYSGVRPGSTEDLMYGGGVHPATGDANNPFRQDMQVLYMQRNWGVMDLVSNGNEFLREYCRKTGARPVNQDTGQGFPPDTLVYTGGWFSRRPIIRQEPQEPEDAWYSRIDLSVLSPYTVRLIDNAASLILRRAIKIEGNGYWEVFAEDVDGWGSSINEFARRVLRSALTYGHSGILVDYPPLVPGVRTMADERMLGNRRPYFVGVSAPHILGWRQAAPYPTAPMTQLRLYETTTVPDGDYGQVSVEQVRVITPDRYETYRRTSNAVNGDRVPVQSGQNQLRQIPFVPLYTNRTGFLTSMPPLIDVAELNLTHYQAQADHLHAMHVAAQQKLVLEGFNESSVISGVNYAISMEPGSKAYVIQADSSSFGEKRELLLNLENQMSTLGVTKLLGQKFVAESADAKRVDQAQANSVMAIISLELQSVLNQTFALAASYLNITPPRVQIDRDFDFYRLLGQDAGVLSNMLKEGQMTPEMFVQTMRQGEWYSDTADVEREVAFIRENMVTKKEEMEQEQDQAQMQAERLSLAMQRPDPAQPVQPEDGN